VVLTPETSGSSSYAFDALLDAAVDAIVIIDDLGTVLRFNRAAQGMFEFAESEVLGRNVTLLMPEPYHSQHDEFLNRYSATGKAAIIGIGREVTGVKSDGRKFPMFLSVGEIRRETGSHFVGIIRDLTDMQETRDKVRHLEDQLLHADRLVMLGELTAGIAHEINQPLTAIAAYADAGRKMSSRGVDFPADELYSICERIGEQSRRAAEVVQRLRKLVRSGAVRKARHDINHIIKNTLLLFEYDIKKTNIEIQFYPAKTIGLLYVDEIHIQQILVNLIKNSLDAISQSGQRDGRIEIRVKEVTPDVLISVTDNGPGVPEANQGRLFESFFTTKPKGVGLGLSICKTIAGAHGGNLKYSLPRQGGSRFTLLLPLESIG
jgi:two-component system sensor kinase FixL